MSTIEITNFSGRLTRIINGDMNSGFAKFAPSFGYDPFTKPMNLTWLETPTSIAGLTNISMAGKVLPASIAGANVHIITGNGNWYQIRSSSAANSNLNSVISVQSIGGYDAGRYNFGASMEFFGSVVGTDTAGNSLGKLYVGLDDRIVSVDPNGSSPAHVGNSSFVTAGFYHPIKPFLGTLVFGNGPTVGQINNTGTVVSSVLNIGTGNIYSALNPGLGTQAKVVDIEVSPSNDYIAMASTNFTRGERLDTPAYDSIYESPPTEGKIFFWNGTDQTITAGTSVPTYFISALETFFRTTSFFAADTFGTTFNTGSGKIVSLPDNTPPSPNAVTQNGNFITWACPETDANDRFMSLYYYGSLDEENPIGLYRVLRWTTAQVNGFVSKVPLNLLVSNRYRTILDDGATTPTTVSYGKHYISVSSGLNDGSAMVNYLLSFLITPTTTGTPQLGVYETQTQIFSKRISVSQIRVYCEPAVAGNGFQIDLIGSDGAVLTNGTFNYLFGEVTDPQSGSTAVERINFNANPKTQYALGIRITNTGTTNMTIKKIEIDYQEEGL